MFYIFYFSYSRVGIILTGRLLRVQSGDPYIHMSNYAHLPEELSYRRFKPDKEAYTQGVSGVYATFALLLEVIFGRSGQVVGCTTQYVSYVSCVSIIETTTNTHISYLSTEWVIIKTVKDCSVSKLHCRNTLKQYVLSKAGASSNNRTAALNPSGVVYCKDRTKVLNSWWTASFESYVVGVVTRIDNASFNEKCGTKIMVIVIVIVIGISTKDV